MMKMRRSEKQATEMMSSDTASETLRYNTAMAIKPLRQSYDWHISKVWKSRINC